MSTQLPDHPAIQFGRVVGRFALAVGDQTSDVDEHPDLVAATAMTVSFTPAVVIRREEATPPTTILAQKVDAVIGGDGLLRLKAQAGEQERAAGVWLVTGVYKVDYKASSSGVPTGHHIEVTVDHTEANPLDLTKARPYVPPPGTVVQAIEVGPYAEGQYARFVDGRIVGATITGGGAGLDSYADVEALQGYPVSFPPHEHEHDARYYTRGDIDTAMAGVNAALAAYTPLSDPRLTDARTPTAHAGTHATGGSDPLTPASIGAATAAQGALADTATQPGDDAATLGSGAATDGQVLTADGLGGAAWEDAVGGGGGGFPYPPITAGHGSWWAGPAQSGTGGHKGMGFASLYPLPVGQPVRVTAFQVNITGAGDGTVHAAIYGTTNGTDPAGAAKVADLLVAADATTTGAKTASSLAIDLTPGLYWVAVLTTGTVQPTFAGTSDPLSLLVPKRAMTRNGGLEGASSLASLPATYPAFANDFNLNGSMLWYGLQTAVIP